MNKHVNFEPAIDTRRKMRHPGSFDIKHSVLQIFPRGTYADPHKLLDDLTRADLQRRFPLTPCGNSAHLREMHAQLVAATGGFSAEAYGE